MQQYLLHPHVYMCVTDDHAVLLDLKRDKYIGIGPRQLETLAANIKGWPSRQPSIPSSTDESNSSLTRMIEAGMLTLDPSIGKEAHPVALPRPTATLTEPDFEFRPSPRAVQVLSFIFASLTAKAWLKLGRIHAVVDRVKSRKQYRAGQSTTVDMELARELVAAFLYLRPLLFDAQDECLYDSLALIEFLARHDLYPTWVIGVQTRPFLAHSWVQYGNWVFNDTPEYVGRFTPILAV